MARVLDAPRPVELVRFSDLLAEWDGIALVVSREPTSGLRLRSRGWADAAVRLLAAGAATGVAALVSRRDALRRVRPLVLLGVTCCLALLVDVMSPTGVLRNRFAVASITASHVVRSFPELTTEAVAAMARNGAVVIDARDERSFRVGHIPGAVSVPIDLPLGRKRQVLSGIDRRAPIVIYCQSKGCPYAEELATEMSLNGYASLFLYRGGWVEWRRAHGE
jgi:rhodanese-related sulfurtransferase